MRKMKFLLAFSVVALIVILSGVAVSAAETLNLSDQNPETAWGPVHALQPWIKQIEEKTNGQVKIKVHPKQSLIKGKDNWQAVSMGVVEMGWNMMGYWSGNFPLTEVITLPGLPFRTAEQGSETAWKLYEAFPEIQKEFNDVKLLILFTCPPYRLNAVNKEVKTLEDIKGMTIRMGGGPPAEQLKLLGAVPISIPMPQVKTSLEKGIIGGAGAPWEAIEGFKLYEVIKYSVEVPFSAAMYSVTMNKNKWNSLSPEIQEAIMSVSGLEGSKFWGRNFHDTPETAVMQKAGDKVKFYALSDSEREKWMEIGGKPVWDQWVAAMEKQGHAKAREVLDKTLELLK